MPNVRLRVDVSLCQGHNRCFAVAAELFDLDDLGFATPRGDGRLTEEQLDLAELAVQNCPERAVTIIEVGPTPAMCQKATRPVHGPHRY